MCLEYQAVKRVYNQLREMDAEFAEELRREVSATVGHAKRKIVFGKTLHHMTEEEQKAAMEAGWGPASSWAKEEGK